MRMRLIKWFVARFTSVFNIESRIVILELSTSVNASYNEVDTSTGSVFDGASPW